MGGMDLTDHENDLKNYKKKFKNGAREQKPFILHLLHFLRNCVNRVIDPIYHKNYFKNF